MHWVRKICNFRLKSPSVSKTVYETGPWLLWINRKSDRSASVPMNLSDLDKRDMDLVNYARTA